MSIKKFIGKVHLWLGLSSGLLVLFLGLTGCILAFQREIEMITKPYQYVASSKQNVLPPSVLQHIAMQRLPGKVLHSITYGRNNKAAIATFYHSAPDYYYLMYLNPYTGQVLRTVDMDSDFFRIVINGHFYLWLPPQIGKPIVASATLVFVVMMITGIVLWWPRNRSARKQRFSVKWNARWRRRNYDLHNVLGFYMSWVAVFIAITGLVMGFQWVGNGIYWLASGGKQPPAFYEPAAHRPLTWHNTATPSVDRVWHKMTAAHTDVETIEIHFPANDTVAIEAAANPDATTYWKTDYRYFDQHTLSEYRVAHSYGRFSNASAADKLSRMNYDIHVGAVLGLPGKILAFFASLLAASLPVTGFLIWRGRRHKAAKNSSG